MLKIIFCVASPFIYFQNSKNIERRLRKRCGIVFFRITKEFFFEGIAFLEKCWNKCVSVIGSYVDRNNGVEKKYVFNLCYARVCKFPCKKSCLIPMLDF
jgi:hypothetical protein